MLGSRLTMTEYLVNWSIVVSIWLMKNDSRFQLFDTTCDLTTSTLTL